MLLHITSFAAAGWVCNLVTSRPCSCIMISSCEAALMRVAWSNNSRNELPRPPKQVLEAYKLNYSFGTVAPRSDCSKTFLQRLSMVLCEVTDEYML